MRHIFHRKSGGIAIRQIKYQVTRTWNGRAYGVLGTDRESSAVTMPFLREEAAAHWLAGWLSAQGMPLSEFCEYYASGALEDDVKAQFPHSL